MDTTKLKNNLARRILDMQSEELLKKVENLINEDEIVGYNADGSPVHAKDYLAEMERMDAEIDNGTLPTMTTDEVYKSILGQ